MNCAYHALQTTEQNQTRMQNRSWLFITVTRIIIVIFLFTLLEITTAYSEKPTKNIPLISCKSCHLITRAHYKVGEIISNKGGYHTMSRGYEPKDAQGNASSASKPGMISDGANIAVDGEDDAMNASWETVSTIPIRSGSSVSVATQRNQNVWE